MYLGLALDLHAHSPPAHTKASARAALGGGGGGGEYQERDCLILRLGWVASVRETGAAS